MTGLRQVSQRSGAVRAALRWTGAALVIVAAHGGAGWLALNWQRAEAMSSEPPPAVMIELAPLAVAPEAPPEQVAPGPQMTEAQPETQPEPIEKPIDEPKPDPVPPVLPQVVEKPPEPDPPLPPSEVKLPELPQRDKAEAVLAPLSPPPKPRPEKKPPSKKREAERKKPLDPDRPKRRQTSAPPTSEARRAETAAAPSSAASTSPSVSPASWRSALQEHLNRYKRFPPGAARTGTALVAFSISRSGQVLSARLAGSSGDAELDQEAVAMMHRASPVPAPPAGFGGAGAVLLTAPVKFDR